MDLHDYIRQIPIPEGYRKLESAERVFQGDLAWDCSREEYYEFDLGDSITKADRIGIVVIRKVDIMST